MLVVNYFSIKLGEERKGNEACYIFFHSWGKFFVCVHEYFRPNQINDGERYLVPKPPTYSIPDGMHHTPLAHLISPNTHAPCQHPSSNLGWLPLALLLQAFKEALCTIQKIWMWGSFSHEHLPPIGEGVCVSKSQHSCPLGVQFWGPF